MRVTARKRIANSISMFVALACLMALAMPMFADNDKQKEQQEVRKMAQDTLHRLHKVDPKAKAAVQGAAGYAAFSNTGVKILLAGWGRAKASP